ncbi:MAG: ABC transporter permease [Lachnospiraceae bacterium]|nr:ABC transporter permease [Lachnospiraceae bacterium]
MEKKQKAKHGVQNLVIGLVFIFLYIPIFVVILFSFNTSEMNIVFEGFTLQWYGSFFKNRTLMESLQNTLIIAAVSTIVSVVIGTLGAVGMSRYEFKGRKLVDMLLYVPIVIPEIVLGVAMLSIFSILNMPMGLLTMTLAHITFCIPFVVISVRASLAGMDKSLEEASMDLGASHVKTFLTVTLPLIMPGVISGATLSLSLSIDDVIISFFVSGPGSTTLPLKILEMVKHGVSPEVNALSTIITLIIIVAISLNTQSQIRKLRRNEEGKTA